MNRIQNLSEQISAHPKKESLTVTDNRTGKTHEIPIKNNYILATEL
jgi:hypothetical protein